MLNIISALYFFRLGAGETNKEQSSEDSGVTSWSITEVVLIPGPDGTVTPAPSHAEGSVPHKPVTPAAVGAPLGAQPPWEFLLLC